MIHINSNSIKQKNNFKVKFNNSVSTKKAPMYGAFLIIQGLNIRFRPMKKI